MKREWKDSNNCKIEKELKKLADKLEKICRKGSLKYAEVYLIESGDTGTLNVRAKHSTERAEEVCDTYIFIPEIK